MKKVIAIVLTLALLMMGAGLWKHVFCISSYCVDAQKMADAVGLKGWANDGKIRYFL